MTEHMTEPMTTKPHLLQAGQTAKTAQTTQVPPDAPEQVLIEVAGRMGCISLNRPRALNALSPGMVRAITQVLQRWRDDPQVAAVVLRGMGKEGPFGAFCAGGDIRFFHQAALAGDAALGEFFTDEYRLNHLIHTYPKPCIALLDGICMGGGMGLAQGAGLRVVTPRSKLAMPETLIGLFPDVGGGYFLSRCPGHLGEYLGLVGPVLTGPQALACGLADVLVQSEVLPDLWLQLQRVQLPDGASAGQAQAAVQDVLHRVPLQAEAPAAALPLERIDAIFGLPSVSEMLAALDCAGKDQDQGQDPDASEAQRQWCAHTAQAMRQRSPLMLQVTLVQIRRARHMPLADVLRMERDMVHHCFAGPAAHSETVEGIRALAIDKDHAPRWQAADVQAVGAAQVARFFESPWAQAAHPLRDLAD